ncbi:receptor-like protein EIX2 [Prosopis cineraria]|uniref:receptor-like protein EIX2 n=1 Tax=Prosopis cineraria TaxID=364024 RepID=UPI00240FA550|nr:receptor-like protein EIX2 [Prosopis cineraria]
MLPKCTCSIRLHCNEKDHHLLLNFKHTLVDPSSILSSWSDERDCCEWTGVMCDNTTGRVIELSLPYSTEVSAHICAYENTPGYLTGELDLISLLQLECLIYLDLSYHDFKDIVQNDYVVISNSNNQSTVQPPHPCQNFSSLHHLDLSANEDLHIDSLNWLSHVPSLKYLDLSFINLRGTDAWVQISTLLVSLTELHLDDCQLRDINPSLKYVNFTSIEVVTLSQNGLTSDFFPGWLFNLSDVTTIDLRSNHFQSQLPKKLLKLRKLEELYLENNEMIGPIPDWLGQFEHLQSLSVFGNLFSGPIPLTLGNLSSLKVLHLADNHLMGNVSERNFVKLSNLKFLSIGALDLSFDFNSMWIPPFQLRTIYLVHMVVPKLPLWIYTQTSLERFIITRSKFSFDFQDNFWHFIAPIPYLHLQDNIIINGDISNVLLNSTIINLISNNLKGGVPQLSPNVVVFNVGYNSLQGSISPLLCKKMNGRTQLKFLDMSNNLLSGGLTNCWLNWKSLVVFKLGNNSLAGTIPPSMGFLSDLKSLHLNNNNLFGQIPLSLENCHNLQIFDVGGNNLSGNIPNWIGYNTKVLQLRSNQFSGNIPLEICQLTSLIILDLADNKISGSIPICLFNLKAMTMDPPSHDQLAIFCIRTPYMTYIMGGDNLMLHAKGQELSYGESMHLLRFIDLSSNVMFGTIPPEIFTLIKVQHLNLSHNEFDGNISKEIGNMKNLEALDLSRNQLSGEIPSSMGELSFLGTLNLSFNNFIGKIPSGTQLRGFDVQSYIGNPNLCGAPLPNNCTDNEDLKPTEKNGSEEDEFLTSFYIGSGVGFALAFWIVCGAIFFNKSVRHSYFRFLYGIRDKLYVMMAITLNRFN